MIGSSKNNRENYLRKRFSTQEKEIRVNFNPRLSANRPSNNWALGARVGLWSKMLLAASEKNPLLPKELMTDDDLFLITPFNRC